MKINANILSKFKHGPSKSVLQQYKTSFLHKFSFTVFNSIIRSILHLRKMPNIPRKLEDFFKIV